MKTASLLTLNLYATLYHALVNMLAMEPLAAAQFTYLLNTANIDTCRGLCDDSVPESSAERFTNKIIRISHSVEPLTVGGFYDLLDLVAENINTDFLIEDQLVAFELLLGTQDRLDDLCERFGESVLSLVVLLDPDDDNNTPFDCDCHRSICRRQNAYNRMFA